MSGKAAGESIYLLSSVPHSELRGAQGEGWKQCAQLRQQLRIGVTGVADAAQIFIGAAGAAKLLQSVVAHTHGAQGLRQRQDVFG